MDDDDDNDEDEDTDRLMDFRQYCIFRSVLHAVIRQMKGMSHDEADDDVGGGDNQYLCQDMFNKSKWTEIALRSLAVIFRTHSQQAATTSSSSNQFSSSQIDSMLSLFPILRRADKAANHQFLAALLIR